MVQADEYRARRRRLFEGWSDRDVTTAPGARARNVQNLQTQPNALAGRKAAPPPAAPAASPRSTAKLVAIGVAVAVALAIGAYVLLAHRTPAKAPGAGASGAAAAGSASLSQIRQAATDFVAKN